MGKEDEMVVTALIKKKSTAGVAVYLRFLFALCRECKPRPIGYWIRLRLGSGEDTIVEMRERKIFFQAEDGIRFTSVTGVQTFALPICRRGRRQPVDPGGRCHRGDRPPLEGH